MKNNLAKTEIQEWEKNNKPKFRAWSWYIKGVREQESYEYLNRGEYHEIPLGKLVGEFSEEYDWKEREENYVDEGPPYENLAESKIIGGIINTTEKVNKK